MSGKQKYKYHIEDYGLDGGRNISLYPEDSHLVIGNEDTAVRWASALLEHIEKEGFRHNAILFRYMDKSWMIVYKPDKKNFADVLEKYDAGSISGNQKSGEGVLVLYEQA